MDGFCDPAFAVVREEFRRNFEERGEGGAALCVRVHGRVVVDLWGGDGGGPDTLVNVFSVGKGLSAIIAARLAGSGRLDVALPVAKYWPEFAAAGKGDVTVAQLLSHQAGLPAVRRRLPEGAMLDRAFMVETLAAEEPWWEPGAGHGYHVNTFGFLVGEVVRRVSGKSLGAILREEIGADAHIGLPGSEFGRVAEFRGHLDAPAEEEVPSDKLMEHNAYFNPLGISGFGVVNTDEWRAAEIPSTNAHASARGVAQIYADLVAGRLVSEQVLKDATTEQVYGTDLVLDRSTRFGLGFQLTQPERPLGPNPEAFGHFGAGGSLGFCDPSTGLAFGYVMDEMGPRWQNPRNRALVDAVYACL